MRLFVALLLVSLTCSPAAAQSLLERLEKRLQEAVPAEEALPVREGEGAARPGFLGLTADKKNGALEVISVRAGGPADAAGVKPGDKLVSIGGVEVGALDDIGAIVDKLPAGSTIEVTVSRGGKPIKLPVTLAAREGVAPPRVDPGPLPEEIPLDEPPAALGVRALAVTAETQRRYSLAVRRGAVIESIQLGSPADRYGLPIGAAIVAIDGAAVDGPDDLAAHIGVHRPGDTIELSYYVRDTIYRKKVRLGPAGQAAPRVEERPLIGRLERAIEGVVPEREGGVLEELRALRERVEELEARVQQLEAERAPRPKPAAPEDPELELPAPTKPLEP